jgi:hypothetical protein
MLNIVLDYFHIQRYQYCICCDIYTIELGYDVMKMTEYSVSLQTSFVTTEENNVTINSEELIGTAEYLTLQTSCRINRCCVNRVLLCVYIYMHETERQVQVYCHT